MTLPQADQHNPATSDSTTPKPRKGAPFGNQNAFRSGVTMLSCALSSRVKPRARRIALQATAEIIQDKGGDDNISSQQRFIAGIIGFQVARYDAGKRAYDS